MTSDKTPPSSPRKGVSRRDFLKLALAAGGGLVAAGALNPNIAWAAEGGLSREGVKARLLIGSDLHIQAAIGGNEGRDADKKLEFAMDTIYALDPQLDAFCLVGDITDSGNDKQYQHLMALLNGSHNTGYSAGNGHTKVILCQGNHETYTYGVTQARSVFESKTGQQANKVVDINGVPVITMGPIGASDHSYSANYDFFCNALDGLADRSAPIVLLTHHQVRGTSYTSTEWYGDYGEGTGSDIVAVMKQYPNIIHFSGHSHATLEDERSINQDLGFTAIQDSTIGAYYENETGKVDPDSGNGASVPPQTSPAYTDGKNIAEASQCVILDIMEDGTAKVYRLSLVRSKVEGAGTVFLYEPWTIDIPGMVSSGGNTSDTSIYRYTSARESTAAPVFPAGAKVTVDEVTETSAKVHFPSAAAGSESNLDMVHEYKIIATPTAGDPVVKRIFADYYRPAAYIRKTWDVLVKGLLPNTSYTVSVAAQTSWSKERGCEGSGSHPNSTGAAPNSTSAAIVSAAFSTSAKAPTPRAVLDIDFRNGKPDDAMGHSFQLFGTGAIVDDTDVLAGATTKVYQSAGNGGYRYVMTDADYDAFGTTSTLEVMFKTSENIQDEQAIFSNQQSAGAGLEYNKGNLEYWYRDAKSNSYVSVTAPLEAQRWIHAVAVADGKKVTLYVDGKKCSEAAASGMVIPDPKFYYVGCDTNSDGNPEFLTKSGTRIAFARLLPYAMTAEQVQTAWAAAQLPPAPELLLDVDFAKATSAATVGDACGHEAVNVLAANAVVADEISSRNVFVADGNSAIGFKMTDSDYAYLGNEHALELLFMMGETDSDQCLLSNQQYAGDGLEVAGNAATKGKLAFWLNSKKSGTPKPAGSMDTGTWHHAMGTYDGHTMRLYIDGVLQQEEEALGGMKVPAESSRVFFVGSDVNGNGMPELVMQQGGKIAFARILSKVPTAEEIAARARAALDSTKKPDTGDGGNQGGSGDSGNTGTGSGSGTESGSGTGSGTGLGSGAGTGAGAGSGTGPQKKSSTTGGLPKTGDTLPLIGTLFGGFGTLALGLAGRLLHRQNAEAASARALGDAFGSAIDTLEDDELF